MYELARLCFTMMSERHNHRSDAEPSAHCTVPVAKDGLHEEHSASGAGNEMQLQKKLRLNYF
jgi:hypothetical protein